jgi:hypothetical protein
MDASWMQDAKYSAYWAQQQSLGQENFFFYPALVNKNT